MPFTTDQAAKKLGVGIRRVQKLIQEGRIEAVKIGRDWMIPDGFNVAEADRANTHPNTQIQSIKNTKTKPKK